MHGRTGFVVALALAAGVVGAGPAAPATRATSPIAAALPASYLAGSTQAKPCKDFLEPIWVSWLSYAGATVGDEWSLVASSPTLCTLAAATAGTMLDYLPANDGAGASIPDMQTYAIRVGRGTDDDPIGKHVPKGWQCYALPSFWGASAWSYATLDRSGTPGDKEFAVSSGPAAGAGYCVSGAKSDQGGHWHGGKFFWWAPDTSTCQRRYKLKDIPDPKNPGETTNPPYPAAVWGDYQLLSC